MASSKGERWAIRSPGCLTVSAVSLGLRRRHESLMLEVAIPDTGESLDVPHFGRADVHLALLADKHRLTEIADVILLDADG